MCDKVPFTKREAKDALKQNTKSSKQYRKELRYYYCLVHNAWHLTSMVAMVPPIGKPVHLEHFDDWNKLLNI